MMKIFKWRDALFSLFLVAGIAHAEPARLTEVLVVATPDKARISIHFSKVPSYKVFSLSNPSRLVIDLKETDLKANLSNLNLAPTPLNTIRSGLQPNHGLRLVVDLKKPLTASGLNTAVDQDRHRLVVEVGGSLSNITAITTQPKAAASEKNKADKIAELAAVMQSEKEEKLAASKEPAKPEKVTASKPLTAKAKSGVAEDKIASPKNLPANAKVTKAEINKDSIDKTEAPGIIVPKKAALIGRSSLDKPKSVSVKGTRDVVIVIDPGHGGKDSGARGANGAYEKHVVLAISKKLQQLIQEEPGMRAVLTRKGDYFISLRERLRIARKDKADLFIAIHADAFTNPNSSGASVFALSATGASSEAARWLAEKENYSELGGIPLSDKSDLLRSVLIDLSQTGIISLSLQLGNYLLKDMSKIARLHHGSVEQARFVVLKSLDIPSVLVETGFISNAEEERRLSDPLYQQQMAEALFKGIRNYFKQYPPPGTRLAAAKDDKSPRLAKAEYY